MKDQASSSLRNDILLRAAREPPLGLKVPRAPVWIMRQAGRYLPEYHEVKGQNDFFACCRSPEIASALTLQPLERYKNLIDAAIIFSDILVIPQALGMKVEMVELKGPTFPEPLRAPSDGQYARILSKDVDVASELDYVYRAISLTCSRLEGRLPLIGFCGAPWTLLCYMVEGGGSKLFHEIKTWTYSYPEACRELLQKLAEVCVEHLALQVRAGAELVQIFDSWAGELPPSGFRQFSLPYLRYISRSLPARLGELGCELVPMIVFAKGAWQSLDALSEAGYDVIGLDWQHDPAAATATVAGRAVIQGNADPGIIYGTKSSITQAVEEMVTGFGGGKQGWIANLGHGATPYMHPEKVRHFLEEVHRLSGQ